MNTTAGFTCSAIATNASDQSLAARSAGAESSSAAGWGAGTTTVSAAPLFFGRLSVDANANPETKAIGTQVSNFHQSRLPTGIPVSSLIKLCYFFLLSS